MKEIYRLNDHSVPTLPTPHDCRIKQISRDNEFLVFAFEDDICSRDAVKWQKPNTKSLIIRYHLIDELEIYAGKWNKIRKRLEYQELKPKQIGKLFNEEIEYLEHFVDYNAMIIRLCTERNIMMFVYADYWSMNGLCEKAVYRVEKQNLEGEIMKYRRRNTAIMIAAYTHRYIFPICAVVAPLCWAKTSFFLGFGASFSFLALYDIIGYQLRWKHIYCSYQNAHRQKMTPDHIIWSNIKKSDVYGGAAVFGVFGMACILAAVLFG